MEEFAELGLTKNEAKAYETLAKHGKLSASEVSRESGVPYSRVYDILGSLISKGLAEVVPEKTKKFIAGDPKAFLEIIQKRKDALERAEHKISELKQFYEQKEKWPVQMVFGKQAFYKIAREQKKARERSYSIKWTAEYRPEWVESYRKNLKGGVEMKTLTRYDSETEKEVGAWLKINKNMRKFPNDGVAVSIVDDEEVMLVLIKSNVTLLIRDKPFAKMMSQLFLNSYERAEKIE